jgi:DNA-binding response OmpR family regulator
MKGDQEKALEAGASEYVTKPVDIANLLGLIRGWLARDRAAGGPATGGPATGGPAGRTATGPGTGREGSD